MEVSQKAFKNKRKTKERNEKGKGKIVSVDIKSSEGIYPQIVRCKQCFRSHFPSTRACTFYIQREKKEKNMANVFKKTEILDDETINLLQNYINYLEVDLPEEKIIRLRGGAGNVGSESPLIITRAISSAERHGITLIQGVLNEADGNCAFDAVINNINYRECFGEKLVLSSNIYRQIWVTELESEALKYPTLGAGYTTEEKEENWNRLK